MRAEQEKDQGKLGCRGGCHCGRVRFEARFPAKVTASVCNCSICTMTGFVHLIVGKGDLTILSGEQDLVEYRFNTGTARHLFCRNCGVKSFYVPRSHPDGYSVNLNCLDSGPKPEIEYCGFDGRHWRKNIDKLRAV